MNLEQEFALVEELVSLVTYPGYDLHVGRLGDHLFIQAFYVEPDVDTGDMTVQACRKWAFPAGQSEDQIVNTCFKAILTSMEHRTREHFRYQGVAVMGPHRDLDDVVAMMGGRHGG